MVEFETKSDKYLYVSSSVLNLLARIEPKVVQISEKYVRKFIEFFALCKRIKEDELPGDGDRTVLNCGHTRKQCNSVRGAYAFPFTACENFLHSQSVQPHININY
jgi:hypothetical protein